MPYLADARCPICPMPDALFGRGPDSTSCYKAIHIVCLRPGLYNLVSQAFTVVAIGFFGIWEIKLLFIKWTRKSVWLSPIPNPQTPKIPRVKLHPMEDR